MALIKWDPWTDLARVREQLDEAFAGLTTRDRGSAWMPAADVAKEDGTIVIRLDLPGMQEQDVKVEIDGRQLVVSGERQDEHEETREGFYSRERRVGAFVRSFALPTSALDEQISAEFADGVLCVRVPLGADAGVKQIPVQGKQPVGA